MPKFEYSKPVNLSDHHASILVVTCMDNRFREAYDEAAEKLAKGKKYDLVVSAGASKAIVEDGGNTLEDIVIGRKLHGVEEVHIFDHIECGKYGPVKNEIDAHSHHLRLAAAAIKQAMPELKVVPYLFGETGTLDLPEDLAA